MRDAAREVRERPGVRTPRTLRATKGGTGKVLHYTVGGDCDGEGAGPPASIVRIECPGDCRQFSSKKTFCLQTLNKVGVDSLLLMEERQERLVKKPTQEESSKFKELFKKAVTDVPPPEGDRPRPQKARATSSEPTSK